MPMAFLNLALAVDGKKIKKEGETKVVFETKQTNSKENFIAFIHNP